jgi:ABC-2 type transport system permease protein
VFLVVMGIIFSLIMTSPGGAEASLRFVFGNVFTAFILMIITPLITMRLLAEEQQSGTIELLLTSPVRDWEVVLGKFLASLVLYLAMLLLTGYYVVILKSFGNPDWGPIASTYIGLALLGGSLLSLGLLTSAITQNQIIAAVAGFGLILALLMAQFVADMAKPPLSTFLAQLALFEHYFDFLSGVVDTRDVVYYLSVTVGGLFLTTQVLGMRRWR